MIYVTMKKVLVLCTGNSCRSQMAEGYLKHFGGGDIQVLSAGIEAHGLNPDAVRVMKNDGIDISGQTSNLVQEYQHLQFDYVITVCDNARENCPVFPASAVQIHKSFPDPARAKGSEEERWQQFIHVRDLIKTFCREFVEQNIRH
jgi:arsenate reductase (thioredoxin)